MNPKILVKLTNQDQLLKICKKGKEQQALELVRFEISKDCVKQIQRTWRANTWKKAAFFLRLDSSVIACRGPSLLFLSSFACFIGPRRRDRARARAHAFSFVLPPRIHL